MTDAWLKANGALMRVNDAGMQHGLIRAFQNRTYDPAKVLPTVVLRNEDYGRIERLLADGEDVRLQFDIVNHDYPDGQDQLQRRRRDPRQRQGRTRSSCSAATSIRGTPPPAPPTTPSARRS